MNMVSWFYITHRNLELSSYGSQVKWNGSSFLLIREGCPLSDEETQSKENISLSDRLEEDKNYGLHWNAILEAVML